MNRRGVLLQRIGAVVAIIGTVAVVGLHLVFASRAGALWRDEVNTLNIATMPSFPELWTNLSFDSFPALFFVVLRGVGTISTVSDTHLRIFGAVIGLLILGVLWLNSRWLRFGSPLLSLALVGLNPMVIRYGDSIRAYGLGMLLLLLCLGTMWRLTEGPTVGRALTALSTALLSVHCLYYNSFLLFAICVGASAVALRRRAYKLAWLILGIGGVSGASLLVYLPTIRSVESTNVFWKVDFTARLFWSTLAETLGSAVALGTWVWVSLFAFALIASASCLAGYRGRSESAPDKDVLIFGLTTLLVGSAAYLGFLFHLSYMTRPWYYVVFVAFAATCLEMIIAALPWKQSGFRAAGALLVICLSVQPAWAALQSRQTNVDAIARQLESSANADDLILINTWNYAISFRRYYHGAAGCTTIPPIDDLRSHRMDLIYRQVMAEAPMVPVLKKMEETLRAGHTVWLVGALHFVDPGHAPLRQPSSLHVQPGAGEFFQAWSEQAAFLVQSHAGELVRVQVPIEQPVMRYENLPLSYIHGWRESGELLLH